MARLFLNKTGSSNKFWSVEELPNNSVKVRWGRVGLEGQSQVKSFGGPYERARFIEGKIASKLGEGYVEQSQEELKKEVETAQGLGWQFKIMRMEFVSRYSEEGMLRHNFEFGKEYFPEQGVVVTVHNSWTKQDTHLYLTKKIAHQLVDATFGNGGCSCRKLDFADSSWVNAIRKVLQGISAAVAKIVTQTFAAVGVRALDLGDDVEMSQVVEEAHKLSGSTSVGDQLIMKFACLGNRVLEI